MTLPISGVPPLTMAIFPSSRVMNELGLWAKITAQKRLKHETLNEEKENGVRQKWLMTKAEPSNSKPLAEGWPLHILRKSIAT